MNKIGVSIAAAMLVLVPFGMAVAQTVPVPVPTPALAAQWWQWAVSIPTGQNPDLDPNGRSCMVGQRGATWFLADEFSGGGATRACSVPQGTKLFFPIANAINFNTPGVCGQPSQAVKELRALSKSTIDGVTRWSLFVDGKNSRNLVRRIQSTVFSVALPESNIFDAECSNVGNVPAGVYSPAVDDGYYALLEPLPPGKHTVFYHVEANGESIGDVTYHLTVVPVLTK